MLELGTKLDFVKGSDLTVSSRPLFSFFAKEEELDLRSVRFRTARLGFLFWCYNAQSGSMQLRGGEERSSLNTHLAICVASEIV